MPIELLERLAGATSNDSETFRVNGPLQRFHIEAWIANYGLDVDGPEDWNHGRRWIFRVCPWNSEHTNRSAFIIEHPNGAISAGCLHNGCRNRNWHDLRALIEHPNPARFSHTDHSLSAIADGGWEPPVPFHQFDLPAFPSDAFPDWLRAFGEAEATATQTPVDLSAMLALSVIGAACAKTVVVCIREGYFEPLNIYTVTALPPGNRKSAVFTAMVAPLHEHEAAEGHRLGPDIQRKKSAYKIKESRLNNVQQRAASARPSEQQGLTEAAGKLAEELAVMEIPCPTRLVVSDCTPEKLPSILREQRGRIAATSPEGEIFDLMAGRYSATKDGHFEVLLKGHSGDDIQVDRVGRPSELVKKPAITVGLTVQPDVIQGLIEKQGFRGRGLLGRFLYALPKSLLGKRDTNPPAVSDSVRADYHNSVLALLRLESGIGREGDRVSHVLQLDREARDCMQQFESWVEPQLAEFGDLGNITDWAGKLVGAVGRIAGGLHMAAHAGANAPWEIPIALKTVENAIRIGRYLIPHAKAAFAQMGADAAVEQAKAILRWIEHHHLDCFSKRDLHQGVKGTFKRVEDQDKPLMALFNSGFLRERPEPDSGGRGRPRSPAYEVNPLWVRSRSARGIFENSENCENRDGDQPNPSRNSPQPARNAGLE